METPAALGGRKSNFLRRRFTGALKPKESLAGAPKPKEPLAGAQKPKESLAGSGAPSRNFLFIDFD